jgi:hypothetical protein
MKRIILTSIALLLVVGCTSKRNPNGSISGTIHYKGKPVNGATLRLHPVSGEGPDIPIPVSQEGTFSGYDIPPGEYKIVVESQDPPPEALKMPELPKDSAKAEEMKQKFQQMRGQEAPTIPYPNKYKKVESTELRCTVTKGKQEKLVLELKD